jgi:hypothetical protein
VSMAWLENAEYRLVIRSWAYQQDCHLMHTGKRSGSSRQLSVSKRPSDELMLANTTRYPTGHNVANFISPNDQYIIRTCLHFAFYPRIYSFPTYYAVYGPTTRLYRSLHMWSRCSHAEQ